MLDRIFMQVLDMSKTASIVILLVLAARLVLQRAPKVISYGLWAVVLLRLLCPVSVSAPVSVVPDFASVSQNYTLEDEPISVLSAGQAAYQAVGDALNGGLGVQHIPTTERTEEGNIRYVTTDWWSVWVLFGQYVWLGGMGFLLYRSLRDYLRLRMVLSGASHWKDNIYRAAMLESPMVVGLFRPKIYLPEDLNPQEESYILLHEQHHIRRFDHWMKALGFLAVVLHWFNPLVWLAFRLACRDMEMSCDEAVIRKLGSGIRADYAASLLTVTTGVRHTAGLPLAFGEADPKKRIRNLAKWKKPVAWVTVLATVLCIVLGICLVTDPVKKETDQGVTYYYGTVVDCAMSVVEEGKNEYRSYITIHCDDGQDRLFWAGRYTDEAPGLNQRVKVRVKTEENSGLRVYTSAEKVEVYQTNDADTAIRQAVLAHHRSPYTDGYFPCASFVTLSSEHGGPADTGQIDREVYYGIAYYQEYALNGDILEEGSGACVPTVLTFALDDSGNYTLTEYWEPRDGTHYPEDIKAKYPLGVYPDTQLYIFDQQFDCYNQAMEGLGVGVDVILNTVIEDICIRQQWHEGFSGLMESCENQQRVLCHYGHRMLRYCYQQFLEGEPDELRAKVMSHVCNRFMRDLREGFLCDSTGQAWFNEFHASAMYLRNQMSMEDIEKQHPASWLLLNLLDEMKLLHKWGITLMAEDVSSTGMLLRCVQTDMSAADSGTIPAGLSTDSYFWLEVQRQDHWQKLSYIGANVGWDQMLYQIPRNSSIVWNLTWDYMYGVLPPGHYRIGKHIGFHDSETPPEVFYCEFSVS